MEAAVSGDAALLRQAMLMDPLVGAVCTTAEVNQMVDELLVAEAKWLPQYKEAVKQAKINLKTAKKNGTWVPVKEGYQGALRFPVKTPDVMKAENNKM